jgi:hypothetical protein
VTHGERLAALAEQLDGLAARLEAERDSRCVFTYAYAFMTRRLAAELPTAGMTDPESGSWPSRRPSAPAT